MKITTYKLLGRVKDDNVDYEYVKYYDRIKEKDEIMLACAENIIYKLDHSNIELNDIVEFIEEPKGIPEKINNGYYHLEQDEQNQLFKNKINEIIDYLEGKGE